MGKSANRCLIGAALAVMAAAACPAAAQQPAPAISKIGFVNTARVIHESRTTQKQRQGMEAEFQRRTKEIDAGPKNQIEMRRKTLDEDMNQQREDALKQFVEKTNRIIRRVAEAEKFDAVFLEAAYFNSRIDMTDKVIEELDAGR
jgi:outer membrane protein